MNDQNESVVSLENQIKLEGDKGLFSKPLNIPNYQRGYCWEENQIKPFLESLWFADPAKPYHLGTVIVHIHGTAGQSKVWDVVDGQQRLITLSILKYWLNQTGPADEKTFYGCKTESPLLHCATSDKDMLWHVRNASKIIREWVKCHPSKGGILEQIFFSLVKIHESGDENKNLHLAWTFFNALNSGGKRLSDYDLLKAHHLRFMSQSSDALIQFKAARWDSLSKIDDASSFTAYTGNGKANLYETAFAQTFYLIRTWLRNRPVSISQTPADAKYCVLNHYSALTSLTTGSDSMEKRIAEGITGGQPFFDWAEYWIWQFQRFCEDPVIERFLKVPWKPQQKHLLIIARAVLFYYFCKFGNVYLADACVFVLYRIGKLRNSRQRLKAWYGNDEKHVPHTIEALDESPTPEHFFHYCQMPSNRYVPYYDLKGPQYAKSDEEKSSLSNLLSSWKHGPDWWKRYLAFTSSTTKASLIIPKVPDSIGDSICFKKQVMKLLNDIVRDFGCKYDEKLVLDKLEATKSST